MQRPTFVWLAATVFVAPSATAQTTPFAEFRDRIHETFDVSEFDVQRLELPAEIGDGFFTSVVIDGREELLELEPYSVRTPDFRVLVDAGNDQLELAEVGAPATFRGRLAGLDGTVVAGSLLNGQLHALLTNWDGRTYAIQPLSETEPTADHALHVVYDTSRSIPGDWNCIEVDARDFDDEGTVTLGTGIRWCELAFDTDVEFFNLNGGSVTNTVNDIELVMGLVNVIYERDVNILFGVETIIVRTSEPDPYSSTDPSTLLNQFRNHWINTKTFVKRDTAHMMTGKNLSGSVIGIAFLGVICSNNSGFGLSQSKFSGNLSFRAGLTAHEIGHNYNAQHCSGSQCFIMCPGIGGCGGDVTKFGATEQSQIENFSATRGCTPELAPPLTVPWIDTFEAATVDNAKWPSLQGALTSTAANGEISGTRALHLDTVSSEDFADDYVRSNFVLMGGLSAVEVSLYTQHVGVEAGETLTVEYLANNGDWMPIISVVSDGANQNSFEFHSATLPANAYHDEFRVGIRVNGNTADDEWYIDDFSIGDGCGSPSNYCVTSQNSVGPGAELLASGTSSISANDLDITAILCPAGQTGIFFYGPNQTQVPFGEGFMCVAGGITRLSPQTIDIFGEALLDFDVTGTGIGVGDTVNFQFWYRDPMGGGTNFNLSDAISTTWCD